MRRNFLLTAALLTCMLTPDVNPLAGGVRAQTGNDAPAPPVSVAIVYDTSTLDNSGGREKSFSRKKELFAALADYVRRANPQTEFFVIRFGTTYRLTLDGTAGVQATLNELSKLASSKQEGATSLFDACLFAIDTVARGRHERRAIILMTDGVDTLSANTAQDVIAALKRKKITLYAVNILPPDIRAEEYRIRGNHALGRLAAVSNGRLFELEKDKKEAITFFQTIADELSQHSPERLQQ